MHIDFDDFFRNRIEALLIHASWVEAVRSRLGLEGISQVWNGSAAWYIWLHRAPGVYALVFSEGDVVASNGHRLFEGRFALKCYPYADHPDFGGFSQEERRLVLSEQFDATHTPRFEAAAQIPDSLFTIGSVSLLCDEDTTHTLLTFQSLDALRIHQSSKVSAVSGTDGDSAYTKLVRNVSGWSIGYPLFDCLVGLYAHFARRPPVFLGATRCQGFEYTLFADGSAECRPSLRTTQTALTIGFHHCEDNPDRIETLWHSRLESDEKIQTARKLPVSVDHAAGLDLPKNVNLNPLWWEIPAADFKSELSSTCGCGDSHCHHQGKNIMHKH